MFYPIYVVYSSGGLILLIDLIQILVLLEVYKLIQLNLIHILIVLLQMQIRVTLSQQMRVAIIWEMPILKVVQLMQLEDLRLDLPMLRFHILLKQKKSIYMVNIEIIHYI